jgi:hypothetical protein
MNLFQSIYCNQYEELVRTGRDGDKAHKNGIIIITVAIVVNLFSLFFILMLLGRAGALPGYIERMAGPTSGKAIGRLIAAVMVIVVGAIVWVTFGREAYYRQTIRSFTTLPAEEQKRVARQGAVYFLGSIGVFLLLIGIAVIKGI